MSNRVVYDVSPNPDGGWRVQREGSERASKITATKDEAVEHGRELAKSHDLGQLRIKGEDGTIQTEHTYGKDPHDIAG